MNEAANSRDCWTGTRFSLQLPNVGGTLPAMVSARSKLVSHWYRKPLYSALFGQFRASENRSFPAFSLGSHAIALQRSGVRFPLSSTSLSI